MRPTALDAAMFRRAQSLHGAPLDAVLPRLSEAADHGLLWVAVATALGATDGRGYRRAAVHGIVSLGVASAVANVPAKLSIGRARPSLDDVPARRRLLR